MAIVLKDGSSTKSARLDRLVEFDERSREYPIRPYTTAQREQTSKHWTCRERLDQGRDGACVGFAMAHEIIAKPIQQRVNVDYTYAKEQIYWEAQKIDPWPGGSYPGASPYYEGTSVLAGAKIIKQLGHIEEYRWAFGVEDLIDTILEIGPAVVGTWWKSGMWQIDSRGFIHATGRNEGGHAYLIRGVNLRQGYFTIRNSWGRDWGHTGDAKISIEDMELLLHEDGEACIPLGRKVVRLR